MIFRLFLYLVPAAAVLAPAPARGPAPEAEKPFFEIGHVFDDRHRFPNVVVAMDGSILAFRGQNHPLQVRRSEDGGQTWGPVIQVSEEPGTMGAAVVDENTGDVMVFDHFVEPGFTLYRSRDHGQSWRREGVEIKPDGFGGIGSTHGADSGITLQQGEHRGRLLLPARVFGPQNSNAREWWPYHYNTAIYSDDGGGTWQTSTPFPILGTGEGALAELSDGRIYYNSRMHLAEDARRRIAWSYDGGETWRNLEVEEALPDGPRGTSYGCMGAVVRLPSTTEDVLIYSNLDEPSEIRRGMTIWASFDGGRSWPVQKLVYAGPSAYSSLAAGRPGTAGDGLVYLLFEGGPGGPYDGMQLVRFNRAWLEQ